MREHIEADEPFAREDVAVGEAIERFRGEGQDYKVELIEDLVRDEGVETVSLYRNGPFTDLCRGPHAPVDRADRRFKLHSRRRRLLARRRDRQMLTRIYGTAFFTQGGARRAPRAARAGARARPPQARPRARPLHASARRRRGCRSGCRNGTALLQR